MCLDEFHQQAVEADHLHVGVVGQGIARDVDAFVEIEDRILAVAARNGNDNATEKQRSPAHEILVTAGEGVERPRIDRHRFPHSWLLRIRWK